MIRSLRRKFIAIAMASLLGTMTVLCVSIGAGNHWITARRVDRAISLLYQNGGTFLPPGAAFDPSDFEFQVTPETAFETRYFIVELTARREVKSVDLEHIAAFDRQDIAPVIQDGGRSVIVQVENIMGRFLLNLLDPGGKLPVDLGHRLGEAASVPLRIGEEQPEGRGDSQI